ncbi:MAG: recombinase family protein [Spirosomataceae bacterium]
MKIGYARVSRDDQNPNLQLDALRQEGCEQLFTDFESGATASKERPEFAKLSGKLRSGDVLVIWNLDRLGRSLVDLVQTIEELTQRGVGLKTLTGLPVDTTTSHGKLFLQIAAAFAEFERNKIRERTLAGLSAARARGKTGGRPKGLSKEAQKTAMAAETLYKERKLTTSEIMATLGISRRTLYNYLKFRGVSL